MLDAAYENHVTLEHVQDAIRVSWCCYYQGIHLLCFRYLI